MIKFNNALKLVIVYTRLNALCRVDGLLCVPAGVKEIKPGAKVEGRLI